MRSRGNWVVCCIGLLRCRFPRNGSLTELEAIPEPIEACVLDKLRVNKNAPISMSYKSPWCLLSIGHAERKHIAQNQSPKYIQRQFFFSSCAMAVLHVDGHERRMSVRIWEGVKESESNDDESWRP